MEVLSHLAELLLLRMDNIYMLNWLIGVLYSINNFAVITIFSMFILYCYHTHTVKYLLWFLVGNFPMVLDMPGSHPCKHQMATDKLQTHLIHLNIRDRVGFTVYKLSIWMHC